MCQPPFTESVCPVTYPFIASKDLTDMETGQRGYLLTGDPAYLQPDTDAKGRIEMDFCRSSSRTLESDAARTITGVAVGVLGWIKAG